MGDYGHNLLFGCFLSPSAAQPEALVALARVADEIDLDLLSVQDHPYQPGFLDAWTLLSSLAGTTGQITLFPNVANLPLRPPAVLARSVASLDILTGGRVELGLGAGFAWDAIAGLGGPRRSPGQAVDALAEGVAVIRALWTPGPEVRFAGEYYRLDAARPGPFPVHPVGIWLGAYQRHMLQLVGRVADGWVPTLGYASPKELVAMTGIIDSAARNAGRDPREVRRIYNITGTFDGGGREFLQGPPALWIEQLTELALTCGISGFVLSPGTDAIWDLRRFAEEVAPGVRAAVDDARQGDVISPPGARPPVISAAMRAAVAPVRVSPTPDTGVRLTGTDLLDEARRPHATRHSGGAVTDKGRLSQETLVQIHDHLRWQLADIKEAVTAVIEGGGDIAVARTLINQLTVRQSHWSLGAFCAGYCRVVSIHHSIEDEHMFVALRRADESLSPVLDQLGHEHEVIARVLTDVDAALVAMVEDPTRMEDVRHAVDLLTDVLLSHLAYEERELLEPIGRLGITV